MLGAGAATATGVMLLTVAEHWHAAPPSPVAPHVTLRDGRRLAYDVNLKPAKLLKASIPVMNSSGCCRSSGTQGGSKMNLENAYVCFTGRSRGATTWCLDMLRRCSANSTDSLPAQWQADQATEFLPLL